ncbi:hypothetical protein [Vibrio fluvialis]|uniref:hypothetical protein n=1 Tax=Vibrio fluvialis TaxID=676 RepID=UPI001558F745|nr:hypothetical protein [Vibrio fluvialis]
MSARTKIYVTIFVAVSFVSYMYLYDKQPLVKDVIANTRYITMATSIFFLGLVLYVKTFLKDLGKGDNLTSKELKIVTQFTAACHTKIWLQVTFYAFLFLYAMLIGILKIESELKLVLLLSFLFGGLAVAIGTLISTYVLDRNITHFQSFIALRAKKLEEKNAALELLMKEESFSDIDLEHFRKRRTVSNVEPTHSNEED